MAVPVTPQEIDNWVYGIYGVDTHGLFVRFKEEIDLKSRSICKYNFKIIEIKFFY